MSKLPIFKTSSAVVILVIVSVVVFPVGILLVSSAGPAAFYLLGIPFIIVVGGLIFRGFKGLANMPRVPSFKFIRIGSFIAPVVGLLAGVIAYFNNYGQLGYLFWYPLCVTLGLETILGLWAQIASKRYITKHPEHQQGKVVAPNRSLASEISAPTPTKTQMLDTAETNTLGQQADYVSINPKTASLPPQEPKERKSLIRIIIAAVFILVGLIAVAVVVNNMKNNLHKDDLRKSYEAAVRKCRKKPVVVVEGNDLYGFRSYEAYSDAYKFYENHLYEYDSTYKTKGYFCTIEEASSKFNINNLDNKSYP